MCSIKNCHNVCVINIYFIFNSEISSALKNAFMNVINSNAANRIRVLINADDMML